MQYEQKVQLVSGNWSVVSMLFVREGWLCRRQHAFGLYVSHSSDLNSFILYG